MGLLIKDMQIKMPLVGKMRILLPEGSIFDAELEAFYQNPITGVGIGKVKEFLVFKIGRCKLLAIMK